MDPILVPVDGSEASSRALAHAMELSRRCGPLGIEVLNVQFPVDGLVREFVTRAMIDAYHRRESQVALGPARALLADSGVAHAISMRVGPVAETIAEHTAKGGCDLVVMGTRGMGAVTGLVLGSVATKVVHLAAVPVTLVK